MSHKSFSRGLVTLAVAAIAAAATTSTTTTTVDAAMRHDPSLLRPPMPCVAVRAGAYPLGAGFCPTVRRLDWSEIAAPVPGSAGGDAAAPNKRQNELVTTSPDPACRPTPRSADDFVPESRRVPRC
jgi:hypothetical protein